MRILHVPYSYFPDPVGGTEVYVDSLARCQAELGCEVGVAAPQNPSSPETSYETGGIPVWRFEVSPSPGLRAIYGEGDPVAAVAFDRILDRFQPEVVHLHGITGAISGRLADAAAQRGMRIVFNYHTPTASCVRGTLLRWGEEICDGTLSGPGANPCSACCLQLKGLPRPLASFFHSAAAALPGTARQALEANNLSGGLWTALRSPELTALRTQAFESLMRKADRVVALCNWTRDLLLRNHIPESKIVLCRQGIEWTPSGRTGVTPRLAGTPLRAAFLGRSEPVKGAAVVVQALKENPALPVNLDLFGVSQSGAGNRHAANLAQLIGSDSRMSLQPPLASGDVIPRLREYDFLVAPSQWLETGPLVVLEAFAAGIPVVGSDLGGIAELVRNGVDGLLVAPCGSTAAWAAALRRLCDEPGLLGALRARIEPPRHSRDAARELMPVYESVAQSACAVAGRASR